MGAQKKAELTKLSAKYEEDLGAANSSLKEAEAKSEENKEKTEKIKDLQTSMKEIVEKQEKEVVALDKVRAKIASIVDEPKPVEADPVSNPKPKADLSAFQANLKKINDEEEKKEEEIEARKAAVKAIPANPVVAAAEAAQARAAALAKARTERSATIKGNDELWVANMPSEVVNSFVQTKVAEIRQQLAAVESREDSDSESSDSESDEE